MIWLINEIDDDAATENFKKHVVIASQIDFSVLFDVISQLNPETNAKQIELIEKILEPFVAVGKKCPKCGEQMFISDLPQYDYVCYNCDENFYECEL